MPICNTHFGFPPLYLFLQVEQQVGHWHYATMQKEGPPKESRRFQTAMALRTMRIADFFFLIPFSLDTVSAFPWIGKKEVVGKVPR